MLIFTGKVTDVSGKKLSGVVVEVKQDNKPFESKTTASNGKYDIIEAPFGHIYTLVFKKDGMVSKTLTLDTKKGYFEEAGLKVEVIAPADPADPPKLVAAGKADLAVSYQPQLHLQVAEGLPLIRVGTLVATPLNCLLTLKDGDIKSIADLKGKKVGFSVAGVEEALLTTI